MMSPGRTSQTLQSFRCTAAKALVCILISGVLMGPVSAQEIAPGVDAFVRDSCWSCHDSGTETSLDFTKLKGLDDPSTFQKWVRVFDRVSRGEMPPPDEDQPEPELRKTLLIKLEDQLQKVSREKQERVGRVPSRRLSRQEFAHTLHDLLEIEVPLARYLPPENESGAFDVIAANQEMSSVHVRGLMQAANRALDEAIQLGTKPYMRKRNLNYFKSRYIQMWVDRPVRRGGGTIFKTDQDVVTFRGENFIFRSDVNGFRPPVAGRYRITVKAAAYQPRSSISVSLKRQNDKQGESELFAAWDLVGDDYREVETVKYLRPDDYFYVSADELEPAPDGSVIYSSQPASQFRGEGVKIRRVTVEGPLESNWPPERTKNLFPGLQWQPWKGAGRGRYYYQPKFVQSQEEHLRTIVKNLAQRAYRQPVPAKELDRLVGLASEGLESKRNFVDAVRIPLQAILVSPELIFIAGGPGKLDDRDLASRLSYFLWRSLPDDELNEAVKRGHLSEPKILAKQVDRMLADPKNSRFVNEFLDQWLELGRIDATTPDAYLYPEYDDVLRRAMLAETREFFAYLIRNDLSITELVDSDFTFLNRKLAEHYGIEGVVGEEMRKVKLAADSVRGGILTHASIAKVTANGTVTTPVRRGNFILTNLLGLPPDPPPPNVGSIEPDTRGATTIRQTLKKHQAVESCAVCHRAIDPPGFALEVFDPVGNYRQQYRNSKGVKREMVSGLRFLFKDYELGRKVDSSGVTPEGVSFHDIRGYREHLKKSSEQIARNLLSRLIEFSTGGEIEFADRNEIERILRETKSDGYPLRQLIHQVVASKIFRNR